MFLVPQRAITELQGVRSVSVKPGERLKHVPSRQPSDWGVSGRSKKAWRRAIVSLWREYSRCNPA